MKTRYLVLCSFVIGMGSSAIIIALLQNGYLFVWQQLLRPPASVRSIAFATSEVLYLEDADHALYVWSSHSLWERRGPPDSFGDSALGEHACQPTEQAFLSIPRPRWPYQDCVVGRQYYADGFISFAYVLDAQGHAWRWTHSESPYQQFPFGAVLVLGVVLAAGLSAGAMGSQYVYRRYRVTR